MLVQNYRIKIIKESILIFLLLFPHLRPESLAYIAPIINSIYNVARIISFVALLLLMLINHRKPSPAMIMVLLMQIWILISTYINAGDVQRATVTMMSITSLMMIVDIFPNRNLLKPIFYNFEWLLYVNLITIILYPQGLYQRGVHSEFIDFFLGFKNSFFPYCIVSILISGLLYLKEKKLRPIALMIVSFMNVLLAWSASSITALAVSLLMFFAIVIIRKPKFLTKIKFPVLVTLYLIIDVLFCVFNMADTIPFISGFIENVLKKQTTLSGRTIIWGYAIQAIQQKPIIGYGIGEHINWAGYDWYGHNQIFEMLLEGGLPCLLIFLSLVFTVAKKLEKCNNLLVYNTLLSVFSGVFVFYIAEAGVNSVFYLIFALSVHINELIDSTYKKRIVSAKSFYSLRSV